MHDAGWQASSDCCIGVAQSSSRATSRFCKQEALTSRKRGRRSCRAHHFSCGAPSLTISPIAAACERHRVRRSCFKTTEISTGVFLRRTRIFGLGVSPLLDRWLGCSPGTCRTPEHLRQKPDHSYSFQHLSCMSDWRLPKAPARSMGGSLSAFDRDVCFQAAACAICKGICLRAYHSACLSYDTAVCIDFRGHCRIS